MYMIYRIRSGGFTYLWGLQKNKEIYWKISNLLRRFKDCNLVFNIVKSKDIRIYTGKNKVLYSIVFMFNNMA